LTEPLLTARQVAEHLSLSTNAVLDRWQSGDLPGFRLFGKKGGPVRFRLSEIEEMLESWRVNGPGAGEEVSPAPTVDPARGVVLQCHPSHNREEGDA
jgi:predicted DNA-binding transcriptional regulator AlpA